MNVTGLCAVATSCPVFTEMVGPWPDTCKLICPEAAATVASPRILVIRKALYPAYSGRIQRRTETKSISLAEAGWPGTHFVHPMLPS